MIVAAISLPAAALADWSDPVPAMLERMDAYFHDHEVNGVTLDQRYDLAPTEVARLSVVSQLLGYTERWKVHPNATLRRDIVERADFLLGRFDEISSHTSFDGMLGASLLEAYDATGDPRYLEHGRTVVLELESLAPSETILNGGLMAALALAEYGRLTGDAAAESRAHDIIASEPPYQYADGSFPHWCPGSKDVHYTAWMSMELILIRRLMDDPLILPMLERTRAFLEERVDSAGITHYEGPCPDYPGCVEYYYSIASGCSIDYDTRAFTNELGYTALLFDYFQSPKYRAVSSFMRSLEHGGTFADKWDDWPPPSDPYYPWTIADTSVVNMSVMFWSLASIESGRSPRALANRSVLPDLDRIGRWGRARASARLDPIAPNPARRSCLARFALPARQTVSLDVYDALGRRVRALFAGTLEAGEHAAFWDRVDDAGAACPSGLYFVRLATGETVRSSRVLVID